MHTVSRFAAPPRAALLLLLAFFALINARPVQAADTTPPKITNASISPTGTYGAADTLPTVTVTDNTGVNPNTVVAYLNLNGVEYTSVVALTNTSGNLYSGTFNLASYFGVNNTGANRVFTVTIHARDNGAPTIDAGTIT